MLLNGRAEYIKEGKESLFLEAMDDIGTIKSMDSPRVLTQIYPSDGCHRSTWKAMAKSSMSFGTLRIYVYLCTITL